jgi:glycosyltransferase involved in cell wall biosynthesis
VVHANDLPTSQMVGRAAWRSEIPRVCHHRWIFEGGATDWLNKFGSERHLFVSQALMDRLCQRSATLAECPRAVVHDGLPLEPMPTEADRAAARRELQLAADRPLVLFAGQIIERKGVADLLRAWQLLPVELQKGADLVLIGDDLESRGEYRRRMEELAGEIGCPARFMGFQRNVSAWLTAADVAVVPSHVEPLGNATLEAMAHGLPVLACRVGGIPEMIVDGESGLLAPPHDPAALAAGLRRLLEQAALRRALGQAARERCEVKFSLTAHVEAVVDQYRQVLGATAAARI